MTKDELEDAFWNEGRESYLVRETIELASQQTYDLEGHTACFGEAIIDFANIIPRTPVTQPLIEILLADDRPHCPGTEIASPPILAGSKRTPSDLRENLAKRRMNLIPWSFVIRDSSFS